jgi:excisionase family DNA binding protein
MPRSPSPESIKIEQAAEVLGVSMSAVARMIDAGKLTARLVGSERHVLLDDVLAYRDAAAARRRTAIDEMTQNAEDLGLYE